MLRVHGVWGGLTCSRICISAVDDFTADRKFELNKDSLEYFEADILMAWNK